MKRLNFRAVARTDLAEARARYRAQGIELAERFTECVDDALDAICRSPTMYPVAFRDVRVCLVAQFPYVIYYRDEPRRVLVVGVIHTSRDPEVGRSRL